MFLPGKWTREAWRATFHRFTESPIPLNRFAPPFKLTPPPKEEKKKKNRIKILHHSLVSFKPIVLCYQNQHNERQTAHCGQRMQLR